MKLFIRLIFLSYAAILIIADITKMFPYTTALALVCHTFTIALGAASYQSFKDYDFIGIPIECFLGFLYMTLGMLSEFFCLFAIIYGR